MDQNAARPSTWLDRTIEFFAPDVALRRGLARQALKAVRAYDAASVGRSTANWISTGASANSELALGLARMRNRARDLVRNNEYALSAVENLALGVVGTGFTIRPDDNAEADIWRAWWGSTDCDADGVTNGGGLTRLAARTMYESGEVLIRRRMRLATDRLPVPMQLQVLEPDHLDESVNGPQPNGNFAILGIEFSPIGKRVAYWLFRVHPGEFTILGGQLQSVRVPASEVLHVFDRRRPSQCRGVPRLAVSVMRLRNLADFEEAESVRKKIEACFVAFVTGGTATTTVGELKSRDENAGPNAPRREKLAPGIIKYLNQGETVEFGNPTPTSAGDGFTKRQLHAIACGAGITYPQLTGDLSAGSFSSNRLGLRNFQRMIEVEQWLLFVPSFVQPIRAWFREAAAAMGTPFESPKPDAITMPMQEYIDPLKDVLARKEQIRGGASSLSEWIRSLGEEPDAVFEEIATERKRLEALGLIFDSDATVAALKLTPAQALAADANDDGAATP